MTPEMTLALPFLDSLGIVCSVPTSQELDALQREVNAIKWWHAIDLGHGIVTPGPDPTPARLTELQIPHDLTGLSVLDVGAWDGFFSFEAERRGAARVLATDSFCWGQGGWGTKAGFELAIETRDDSVVDRLQKVARHDWEHSRPLDLSDEGLLADLEDRIEGSAQLLGLDDKGKVAGS